MSLNVAVTSSESSLTTSSIISTALIVEIEKVLQTADKDTLVIFDVDDVLFQPADQILQKPHRSNVKEISKNSALCEDEFYSILFSQGKAEPVCPQMISLIHTLQSRNVHVLALTHCCTGSFGCIRSMAQWRLDDLKRLGYHFDRSWPLVKRFSIPGFEQARFEKGVIFSTYYEKGTSPEVIDYEKGLTLASFLEKVEHSFNKIIFIDDLNENLLSVHDFCKHTGIAFMGIEYTAVLDVLRHPLNKERISFQFKFLEEEKSWLCDQEAAKLMSTLNKGQKVIPHG